MSNAHRLLVVDDDPTLRDTLTEQLALSDAFDVVTAETAQGAMERVAAERIDLVVMDVGLPDLDGREAVRQMRHGGFRGPVIMLTGQASDADTVQGLDAGANDYVTKPFKLAVLLARIRAQLRQYEASEDAVFQIGPYTFRPGAKLLVGERGSKLKLTEKETAILRFLYRRRPAGGGARHAAGRGVGLQRPGHHPHPRDPHLPPAPEDRAEPGDRLDPGDGGRRLQAAAVGRRPGGRRRRALRTR